MILFNKKKILFILSCITISIVYFNFQTAPISIETSSTPLSNHVVILDAGHGLPDEQSKMSYAKGKSSIC